MSIIYYILGFGLTLFVIIDLIWTALWIDGGAGPLSDRLSSFIWRVLKKTNNKFLLNISGPFILLLTLLSWFVLIWAGVSLFFAGNPESIINTTTNGSISWYERVYFSGFTLFTLGLGDYSPQPGFFQLVTALSSGIGMLLLTLGASYIISVISAVVEKRTFSRSVSGLGKDSSELLKKSWNGKDFHQLDLILSSINSQITQLTQQQQAFPLLQFYHSEDIEKTSAIAIAVLDEALSVLHFGLEDKSVMNSTLVEATRTSIDTYLTTAIDGYGNEVADIDAIPPAPDLSVLKDTTIPLVEQDSFSKELESISTRRNQLLTLIKVDTHEWPNTNL